ncbi:MAG: transglycosylase family protein [Acidimicrobiia bacterium]|nr:transglycosylase family protein [Acidimicrobiia bacterium]
MGVLILGFVIAQRSEGDRGSSLDTGDGQQLAAVDGERDDFRLNELARGAVAGIGVGPQTPASAVASQVDEASTLAPAAPAVSESSVPPVTEVAPTTTAPATTRPPTTKKPTTTKPPTTEAPATTVSPTDPTATVDPAASTEPAAPPDPTAGTPPPAETHPQGYVDAGNGVWIPSVMVSIRHCESHDNYKAVNPSSGAAGAYQFLASSWASYGFAAKYGVKSAKDATPAQQDEAALATYLRSGTNPWKASRSCWA